MTNSEKASAQAGETVKAAPEKPESPFFLWAGIALAGCGSLFFNHSHDVLSLGHNYLAVLAGILPPVLAVIVPHAIKHVDTGPMRAAVFAGSIGAMLVSAKGTAVVLTPAYGTPIAWTYSLVLDGIALTCLYALTSHYRKAHAYKLWLAAPQARNQPAAPVPGVVPEPAPVLPAVVLAPEPGPGTTGAVVPAAVPGTAAVPVPAAEPSAVTGTGSAGRGSAPSAGGKPAPGKSLRSRGAASDAAREEIVDEIAARPENQPRPESLPQRLVRGQRILAEFEERTGERMNLRELGKAMRVSKATAGEVRRSITGPEGEQPAEGEEGVA